MCKYSYPAIFKKEYSLYIGRFPDLNCCISFGHSFEDAYEMAEEELVLLLYALELEQRRLPPPTSIDDLRRHCRDIVLLVTTDTASFPHQRITQKRLASQGVFVLTFIPLHQGFYVPLFAQAAQWSRTPFSIRSAVSASISSPHCGHVPFRAPAKRRPAPP